MISIHAPAWGATMLVDLTLAEYDISIHAPAWGATRTRSSPCRRHCNFNPRARVGRDIPPNTSLLLTDDFNPRARVGRDVRPSVHP